MPDAANTLIGHWKQAKATDNFDLLRSRVRGILKTLCADPDEIDDLEQKVLVSLWTAENLRTDRAVYLVCLSAASNWARRRRRRPTTLISELTAEEASRIEEATPDGGPSPEEILLHIELSEKVGETMTATLSPGERRVLEMLADGCQYVEIAERLEITVNNARVQAHNARAKLRTAFATGKYGGRLGLPAELESGASRGQTK
jgi:RNA polymerase sigma factor (sigma-70 family)